MSFDALGKVPKMCKFPNRRISWKPGAQYAQLAPVETVFYFLVTTGWVTYSGYVIFTYGDGFYTSLLHTEEGTEWLRNNTLLELENNSVFWWWHHRLVDDAELSLVPFTTYLMMFLKLSIIHCLWLNFFVHWTFPGTRNKCYRAFSTSILWASLQIYVFGTLPTLLIHAGALPMFLLAWLGRNAKISKSYGVLLLCKLISWLIGLLFLCKSASLGQYLDNSMVVHFVMYKSLQLLSFVFTMIDDTKMKTCGKSTIKGLNKFYCYLLYWPCNILLIIPYEDFERDFSSRHNIAVPMRTWFFVYFRCILCYLMFEWLRRYLYVHTFWLQNGELLEHLANVWFLLAMSIWMAISFQLSCHVQFGLHGLVCALDGLIPPATPLCIVRLTSTSRVWRHFDRGLYNFLTRHVYGVVRKEVARVTNSALVTYMAGIGASFGLVAIWHSNTTLWVLIGFTGMITEYCGNFIWQWAKFGQENGTFYANSILFNCINFSLKMHREPD